MYKQVGEPIFDENGIIKKGVIIRHLILPNHIQNTEHILKWIKDTFDNKIYVSVMAQYFPTYKAKNDDKLNRKISTKEYKKVENYMYLLGIENGYMQDLGKHEEEFVPVFDFRNVTWFLLNDANIVTNHIINTNSVVSADSGQGLNFSFFTIV